MRLLLSNIATSLLSAMIIGVPEAGGKTLAVAIQVTGIIATGPGTGTVIIVTEMVTGTPATRVSKKGLNKIIRIGPAVLRDFFLCSIAFSKCVAGCFWQQVCP